MYVGLKQPRGDGEPYVTPARAAGKETSCQLGFLIMSRFEIHVSFVSVACL